MKKIICIITLFVLSLWAAAQDFTVNWENNSRKEAVPHQNITTVFTVNNTSANPLEVQCEMILPLTWNFIIEPFPLNINSGESDYFLSSFFIPDNTLPGDYKIPVKIFNPDSPMDSFQEIMTVTVIPQINFELQIIDSPDFIIAGESYTVTYQLINTGNGNISLDFSTKTNYPFTSEIRTVSAAFDINSFLLEGKNSTLDFFPGQQQEIRATIFTNDDITQVMAHQFTLIAGYYDQETLKIISKSVPVNVEIIPVVSGDLDIYHKLPLTITAKSGQQYASGYLGTISLTAKSQGSIDDAGFHQIDITLNKELDLTDPKLVSGNDIYYLKYNNPYIQCVLGDTGYGLSALTENYRYGRGIELDGFLNALSFGAYYQQNIWSDPVSHFIGGFTKYRLNDERFPDSLRYRAGINAFLQPGNNYISALYQEFNPVPQINLILEAALGAFTGKPINWAVLLNATGNHGWIGYTLRGIYSEPDYPGYYRDLYMLSGTVNFSLLSDQLKLFLVLQQEAHNLTLNPMILEALKDWIIKAGTEYTVSLTATKLALSWSLEDKIDLSPQPAFSSYENIIKFNVSQPVGTFQVKSDVVISSSKNRLLNNNDLTQNYLFNFDYSPNDKTLYNFSIGYNRYDVDEISNQFLWGLHTVFDFSPFVFDFNFKNGFLISETDNSSIDFGFTLGASYLFADNGKISANINDTIVSGDPAWNNTISGIIEYSRPFSVPISKKQNIGSLSGKILDQTSGQPIKGIILRIGANSAISNEFGIYTFPVLESGEFYINLNRAGIPAAMIPIVDLPAKVLIEKGKNTLFDINLVKGAKLQGKIKLFRLKTEGTFDLEEKSYIEEPINGLIMELSNGTEVKRKVTNKNGIFLFEEIKPGNWTLKVLPYNVPVDFVTESDSIQIELSPGGEKEISFDYYPVQKTIEILEEGDLSL